MTYRLRWRRMAAVLLLCVLWGCCDLMAQPTVVTAVSDTVTTAVDEPTVPVHHVRRPVAVSDTARLASEAPVRVVNASGDTVMFASIDSIKGITGVEVLVDSVATAEPLGKMRTFNPDPQRALWLSALCPGLGQLYNRRYWKLPIVVGAFVGLTYGATWNNRMYKDYSRGYRDVMDDDPDTRSYMGFFPPTVNESDLDVAWLQKVMKNKRDYYRRYREICVIAMVGVYLINIVDAYVDASLAHFDISPDLTLDVAPTAIDPGVTGGRLPSLGLQCAFSF